jgi:hypothetical protein
VVDVLELVELEVELDVDEVDAVLELEEVDEDVELVDVDVLSIIPPSSFGRAGYILALCSIGSYSIHKSPLPVKTA